MTNTPASDLLRAAHRTMEDHLDALLYALKHLTADRVPEIRRLFVEIQRLLVTHFGQEDNIFYPAVRSVAPEVLVKMDEEHEVVRQTERGLEEFLPMLPESPVKRGLDELYRLGIEYHDAIEVHIVDEEDQLLKLADQTLTVAEQQRLAREMERVGL